MGEIRTKLNYSKVAQYLRELKHATDMYICKIETEMDAGVTQNLEDEVCYKKDCGDRVIDERKEISD